MGALVDRYHTPVSANQGQAEPAPASGKPLSSAEEKQVELKPDTETEWMDLETLPTDLKAEYDRLKKELAASKFELKPYARQLVAVGAPQAGGPSSLTFTMMQFNVLADGLSGSRDDVSARKDAKGFVLSPHESLPWRVRGFTILHEILREEYGGGPDVLCLEEVDQFDFLNHFLAPLGYEGRFKPKKKSPCVKVGKKYGLVLPPDGTAIFWKTSKFELVAGGVHEEFADMPHEQAVQVVVLQSKAQEGRRIVVGVLHLKSKKKAEGERLRLEQLLYLMPKVRDIAGDLPVFIGCDLNAESGCTPIGEKECEYEPHAYQSLLGPDVLESKAAEDPDGLGKLLADKQYEKGYGLQLASAYREASADKCEPMYTTWKERDSGNAKHTIDYLFFQPHKGVSVTHVLSIPTDEEVNKETFLPGWEYPSDHFAIQATFRVDPQ